MRAKTFLSALALIAMPALALACPGHDKAAASCMEGYTWDPDSAACVQITTG